MRCGQQGQGGTNEGDDSPDIADSGPGPEDIVTERHSEEALRSALPQALERLTDKQRAAVESTTSGRHSRRDAAAELGAAPGTISSHRARGLAKLRSELLPLVITAVVIAMVIGLWALGHAIGFRSTVGHWQIYP
jgi:DNA-directed RNA polymerase specialized sigma24 family protein